jgi:hypothetical protein
MGSEFIDIIYNLVYLLFHSVIARLSEQIDKENYVDAFHIFQTADLLHQIMRSHYDFTTD